MMAKTVLYCILLHSALVAEDPWGKGCALVCKPYERPKKPRSFIGENLIRFHKRVISPADGPRSHHKPNSSQYTIDAMRKYGFFQGYLMGCDRLMRENEDPWIYQTVMDEKGETFKWDPVK